jgi:ABC-type uncharacterized transport system auxiliary subunit
MRTRFGIVALAILVAGCGGLQHEAKPTVWLALEPALPAGGARAGGPTLEVRDFATAAPFAGEEVASREGASRWSHAAYHRWSAEPGKLVATAARAFLSRGGPFGAVFTPPAPVEADYVLSGAVRSLYWDRERKSAVLEVEASLVAKSGALRGFWVYRRETPVAGDEVAGFIAAASSALDLVLADLARDLAPAAAAPAS